MGGGWIGTVVCFGGVSSRLSGTTSSLYGSSSSSSSESSLTSGFGLQSSSVVLS